MTDYWLCANPPLDNGPQPTGGGRSDFWSWIQNPAEWANIAPSLTEIKIYQNTMYNTSDAHLKELFAWAKSENLPIVLEAGLLPVAGPNQPGSGVEGYNGSIIPLLQKIKSLGGTVSSFDMDEPLYHATQADGPNAAHASVADTATAAAGVLQQAWQVFPNMQVGDVEPVPLTDNIAEWISDFAADTGRPLAFFQADMLWGQNWSQPLSDLESLLAANNVPSSIIINGYGGETTGQAWDDDALNNLVSVFTQFGGSFASYCFQTWMPQPAVIGPDYQPGTLTYLVNEATKLTEIESCYETALNREPTSQEYVAAAKALAADYLTTSQLTNVLNITARNPNSFIVFGSPGSELAVTSTDETIVSPASGLVAIHSDFSTAGATLIGNPGNPLALELTGGRSSSASYASSAAAESRLPSKTSEVYLGAGSTYTVVTMDTPAAIHLPASPGIQVIGSNLGANYFWVGNSDQIIEYGSAYNCTYMQSQYEGTTITGGSGFNQLDLYKGGSFAMGQAITGMNSVILYSSAGTVQPSWNFFANATKNLTIWQSSVTGELLQNVADTVTIADSSQTVHAAPGAYLTVISSPENASANIFGTDAQHTTLEVLQGGLVSLGTLTDALRVKLDSAATFISNNQPGVSVDASVGNCVVSAGAGQTIFTGPGNITTDSDGLGVTLSGSLSDLVGNALLGATKNDLIDITGLDSRSLTVSVVARGSSMQVAVGSDGGLLTLTVAGSGLQGHIGVTSDGHQGTFLHLI